MSDQIYLLKDAAAWNSGSLEDLQLADGALILKEDCYTGQYVSREFECAAFEALAASWNAQTPLGSAVQVQVRVKTGGVWGAWLDYGQWSTHQASAGKNAEDASARLEEGVVRVKDACGQAFQLRAVLHANELGVSPRLRLLCASVQEIRHQADAGEPLYHRSVSAPGYSLHVRDPKLSDGMDLAVAVTSLMNRWGEDVLPEETAYACRAGGEVQGPAYAAAYAGSYGYECYAAFCDAAQLKCDVKNGFASAVQIRDGSGLRWVCVRGFDTDNDGQVQTVLGLDSNAASDGDTACSWTLDEFCRLWTGLAVLLHERTEVEWAPERMPGELKHAELPGEYTLYLKGERSSLPVDAGAFTVCYTVKDGRAYATTAHKHFYYTQVSPTGNLRLDVQTVPAGARLTVYIIRRGTAVVATMTL